MFRIYDAIKFDFASLDKVAVFAFVYTGFGLACVYYLNNTKFVEDILRNTPFASFGIWVNSNDDNNLHQLLYWVMLLAIFYFIIPAMAIKFAFGLNLADFGFKLHIEDGFLSVLLLCLAIMIPLVFLASLTSGFANKYPFLKIYNGASYFSKTLLLWELTYLCQFFLTEFFFRGFLINSLRSSLGFYAIFVMTIPYCMIHFGKPAAEAFAAIAAGIFLGWLSYTNGSIWLGFTLHCSVALLMDFLALYHKRAI